MAYLQLSVLRGLDVAEYPAPQVFSNIVLIYQGFGVLSTVQSSSREYNISSIRGQGAPQE